MGAVVNDVTLDSLLLYMGPVNSTVTTVRLNALTCPSDVPQRPAGRGHVPQLRVQLREYRLVPGHV